MAGAIQTEKWREGAENEPGKKEEEIGHQRIHFGSKGWEKAGHVF